jgi:hypothetical protein
MVGPLVDDPDRAGKPLLRELSGYLAARRGVYRIIYRANEEAGTVEWCGSTIAHAFTNHAELPLGERGVLGTRPHFPSPAGGSQGETVEYFVGTFGQPDAPFQLPLKFLGRNGHEPPVKRPRQRPPVGMSSREPQFFRCLVRRLSAFPGSSKGSGHAN